MNKKKILIVSGGMDIGGIERSLLGLLGEFDYEKYDVDLLLHSVSGEFLPLVDKRCNNFGVVDATTIHCKKLSAIV